MPMFEYKIKNALDELKEGNIYADSMRDAINKLDKPDSTILRISPAEKKHIGSFLKLRQFTLLNKPVPDKTLILFCRQMNTLLKAGIPITSSLEKIIETSDSKKLKTALKQIKNDLMDGNNFSDSIKKHPDIFSSIFVNIIKNCEASGNLEIAFVEIQNYMHINLKTVKQLKRATRYPLIVFVTLIIAMLTVNFMVIPSFKSMFESIGSKLPLITRILVGFSNLLLNHWLLFLIMIIISILSFRLIIKTSRGMYIWDYIKIKIPVIGNIVLRISLARFSRTLLITMRSGVPINEAFGYLASSADNSYVSKCLKLIKDKLERGATLYSAANSANLFTPLVMHMIDIGESSGTLETMMEEVGNTYEEEIDYDLQYISEIIEPIFTILLGGMVIFLMLGVFLPMWNMIGLIE